MNIVRVQKHKELKQRQRNPATIATLLWQCCISFIPGPCACFESDGELPSSVKNSYHVDE